MSILVFFSNVKLPKLTNVHCVDIHPVKKFVGITIQWLVKRKILLPSASCPKYRICFEVFNNFMYPLKTWIILLGWEQLYIIGTVLVPLHSKIIFRTVQSSKSIAQVITDNGWKNSSILKAIFFSVSNIIFLLRHFHPVLQNNV